MLELIFKMVCLIILISKFDKIVEIVYQFFLISIENFILSYYCE